MHFVRSVSTAGSVSFRPPSMKVSSLSSSEAPTCVPGVPRANVPTPGEVPAIALTAYARASDRERAFNAGFQNHLVKPIDPEDLIRAVTGVL